MTDDELATYLPPYDCGCEPHYAVCHGDVVERLALEVQRLRESLRKVEQIRAALGRLREEP